MANALLLITQAFRLAGIISRAGMPTPEQETTGLELLKDLLSLVSTNARLIPYYTSYSLNAAVGDGEYFIPGLVEANTITYTLDNIVRVPLPIDSRNDFFGSARVTNLETLPYSAFIEKTKGGANLYLYAIPSSNYPIIINGKFALAQSVTLQTNLDTLFDRFYIVYLRYQLANYLCQQSAVSLAPSVADELNKLTAKVTDIAPMDLTVTKLSTLSKGNRFSWAQINIGKGWTP